MTQDCDLYDEDCDCEAEGIGLGNDGEAQYLYAQAGTATYGSRSGSAQSLNEFQSGRGGRWN